MLPSHSTFKLRKAKKKLKTAMIKCALYINIMLNACGYSVRHNAVVDKIESCLVVVFGLLGILVK